METEEVPEWIMDKLYAGLFTRGRPRDCYDLEGMQRLGMWYWETCGRWTVQGTPEAIAQVVELLDFGGEVRHTGRVTRNRKCGNGPYRGIVIQSQRMKDVLTRRVELAQARRSQRVTEI